MADEHTEHLAGELGLGIPYHLGLVVHDVDEAIRTYGEAFGVDQWRVRDIPRLGERSHWHGEPQPDVGLRFAYSATEAPFLELVQPLGDADWSATQHLRQHGEGIYHVGYWVDDILGVIERAARLGIEAEMTAFEEPPGGGRPLGFAYLSPERAHGLRVELVSTAGRERLLRWVHTGEWTP